jgi:hypothetical protein
MLNTYIKNRGTTQMLVRNNGKNKFDEINWDADYDGDVANISLDSVSNGHKKHFDIQLDNEDLANLLNIPSINMPIDKRLKMDLERPKFIQEPNIYRIELPSNTSLSESDISQVPKSIYDLITSQEQPRGYISSPLPNEELVVPITIGEKSGNTFTLTPRKYHKQRKTHKTYKVYKKRKTPKSKSTTKTSKTKYQRL